MSRTSVAATLTELGALLGTDGTPVAALVTAGVSRTYNYEPGAAGVQKPCSVTISWSGLEPTDTEFTVRVYVSADLPPATAQDTLIAVVDAVGDLLRDAAAYGPDRWEVDFLPELPCHLAWCRLMVGREDGF